MSFIIKTSLKNIRRKPRRFVLLGMILLVMSVTLFGGAFVTVSLQNGLSAYQQRLGADIIVTPSSAQGHGTVDGILLQGISGNYYMSPSELEKLRSIEGIEAMSAQFYLTSAKASCCGSRVQIIGFDPETDFSILPWIKESIRTEIRNGDILIGADVSYPADGTILFYGKQYHVAGQLEKTGTGLDHAVYTNRSTIAEMAQNAAAGVMQTTLKNVNIGNAASAVLIKVKDGYDIQSVADDINIHVTKINAVPSQNMVSSISEGLKGTSAVIGALIFGIWLLMVVVMGAVFAMLSNERKKEFAVLRVMGASRGMLFGIMCCESVVISTVGAVIGAGISAVLSVPVSEMLKESLSLPMVHPSGGSLALLCVGAVLLPMLSGLVTSQISAFLVTKNETGLLLREDV